MFEVSTTTFHTNVDECRLVAERAKFAKHVMVSAAVCFGEKGIPDKTKVNAKLYVETLLPELVQDCRSVLPSGFIFQQDGAPAHTAKLAHKTGLLPTAVNSLVKMNVLRTCLTSTVWGTMSGELCLNATSQPEPENIDELKKVLQSIWHATSCHRTGLDQQSHVELPEKTYGLQCVKAGGGHFEHTLKTAKMNYLWDFGICNNSQKCFLTMKITSCCWLFRAKLKIWHRIFNIAIALEKTKIIFLIRIVAGSLPYKSRNFGIKIAYSCREIAFCPVEYFNLSDRVDMYVGRHCETRPH